jgi:type II secretory pathway pseudopilin PulG
MRLRQREEGSALLVIMLVMAMMGIIGFAALEAVTRDQRVAGYQKRKKTAFFAAEAAVAQAKNALRANSTPDFAPGTLGDTDIHPSGQPSYSLDTSAGASTTNLGLGAMPGMNMVITQGGAPKFMMRYWRVRVKGEAPGGSLARIEFTSGRVVTN